MTNVREAAFEVFCHFGVDRMFGNPGSTELPMLKGLPFPYVLGLNEAVVMAMADGYARASGLPALVNLHSAAGTGHALGNLFTARRNNAPVVVTAGQQARSILPFDPFLFAERAAEFPQPYVKFASEPARAEDVPAALARAFATALTVPMGPTFVSIPVDDWERPCAQPALPDLTLRTHPDPVGIGRIAGMLNEASAPCLIIGTGAAEGGAWDASVALAEKAGLAVWIAPNTAREAFPEDHPQFAGFLAAWRDRIREALALHDAILVVGAPVFAYHFEGEGPHWPQGARLMALTADPQHLARLPGGGGVLGDVEAGLAALMQMAEPRGFSGQPRRLTEPEPAMSAAFVLARLEALRPRRSVIVEEAPTARPAIHAHLPISRAGGFYTSVSGGLGYSLPAAVGVAIGQKDKVIALLGDGSAMYAIQGLYSARREGVAVSFVVLNNSGYAAMAKFAGLFGMNHVPGCDLAGIDFVQLAEGQGVPAQRVERTGGLNEALAWSLAAPGPTLLDIRLA